jgi:hypothetical protein
MKFDRKGSLGAATLLILGLSPSSASAQVVYAPGRGAAQPVPIVVPSVFPSLLSPLVPRGLRGLVQPMAAGLPKIESPQLRSAALAARDLARPVETKGTVRTKDSPRNALKNAAAALSSADSPEERAAVLEGLFSGDGEDGAPTEVSLDGDPLETVQALLDRSGPLTGEQRKFLGAWLPSMLREGKIGRAPTDEERERMEDWFPGLAGKDWRVTGAECAEVNCYAWAMGEGRRTGAPTVGMDRLAIIADVYGLVSQDAGEAEDDAAVAEFAKSYGPSVPPFPTHWSRHLAGPWWESKIGGNLRIIHRLRDLEGDAYYGQVSRFYRGVR